jgi:hypothetical protein
MILKIAKLGEKKNTGDMKGKMRKNGGIREKRERKEKSKVRYICH